MQFNWAYFYYKDVQHYLETCYKDKWHNKHILDVTKQWKLATRGPDSAKWQPCDDLHCTALYSSHWWIERLSYNRQHQSNLRRKSDNESCFLFIWGNAWLRNLVKAFINLSEGQRTNQISINQLVEEGFRKDV